MDYFTLFVLCMLFCPGRQAKELADFYTAAVVEHARFEGWDHPAKWIVEANLAVYRKATEVAMWKGADMIVFPEYAIFPVGTRQQLRPCMEDVPDPSQISTTPCNEPEIYNDRPILHNLSCMAKTNSIVLVAMVGDIKDCRYTSGCRPDGVFYFNTNVVFGKDGKLLQRHYKQYLYNETAMDPPTKYGHPIFQTDFGTFATYNCFDIQWGEVVDTVSKYKPDGVALTAMWNDEPPQVTSLQVFESFAREINVTLLASNVNLPGKGAVGSGIFSSVGTLAYTYNPDHVSKVIVARVPKYGKDLNSPSYSITAVTAVKSWSWTNDGKDVTRECSYLVLGNYKDIFKDYRCYHEQIEKYTFVQLSRAADHVSACNNGMCCSLSYVSDNLKENFYLGVYNGTQNSYNSSSWCEENCVLTACEPFGNKPCIVFPRKTQTVFRRISLNANFTSESVYPSMLESGMRLVPWSEWNYQKKSEPKSAKMNFENPFGRRIIVIGMKGRCYSKDAY